MQNNDLFGFPVLDGHKSILAKTFDYPPFSVLSARDGWWQERKRQWLALGIKSEVGRGGGLLGMSQQTADAMAGNYPPPAARSDVGQRPANNAEGFELLQGRPKGAAFDNRRGLATWQKDKKR